MFCLWVYALPVIARIAGDTRHALLIVSGCFALYALLATLFAFALPRLIGRFGAARVHGSGLLIGAAGLAVLGITQVALLLVPAFVAIAVAWSCMANIPYALAGAAAPEGRGAHTLRLFGFSTVIPQIVVSLCLAIGATWMFGDLIGRVMVLGGAMMAASGVLALVFARRLDVPIADW
ncbi:MAG TPA: hypothetical protein VF485_13940 [Sphingomonas sp.]